MNPTQDFKTAYDRLTSEEQATYSKFNPNVNTLTGQPITAGSLAPQTALRVPPPSVNNTATGIIEQTASQNNSVRQQNADELARQQEIDKLTTEKATAATGIKGLFERMGLRGQEKLVAEESAGIPKLQQEATEITNQIEAKQLALRRQVEDLDRTFQGSVAGKNEAINAINRQGARELADLSIIQNARNRNLLTAQSIVDRKIDLETEDLKTKLEGLKFFYDENKENLSKEEQRQFETATKKADREYTETREKVKTLENTKLDLLKSASEQKAPNSVLMAIQQSKTVEDAIQAAGQFGGDMLARQIKEAQLEALNIKNKQDKEVLSVSEAKSLGVPYGTTKAQAIALGKVPGATTLTAAQSTALGYANRTVEADKIISDLGSKFTGLGSYLPTASIFGVNIVPNALKSDDRQMFEQAQRNFVNSVLRRESGAAISPSEFENAALQYFPQPGDSEAVVKQKAANRQTTIDGLLISAGQPIVKNLANTATQTDIDYVKSLNLK